jgi:hypothetical protein
MPTQEIRIEEFAEDQDEVERSVNEVCQEGWTVLKIERIGQVAIYYRVWFARFTEKPPGIQVLD